VWVVLVFWLKFLRFFAKLFFQVLRYYKFVIFDLEFGFGNLDLGFVFVRSPKVKRK